MRYEEHFSTRKTPQSEPIPGKSMVLDSAGGHVFAVDDWTRLDRFLILGSEGGTYYIKERKLTVENAQAVHRCLTADGPRTVARIVEISDGGRAPKNDAAIFALAMAAGHPDLKTRYAALAKLPKVCRIGTHLFQFLSAVEAFRGWGRGLRNAVGSWYNDKGPEDLAYQMVKYQNRAGWSHRDALRLAHPKANTAEHDALYHWACGGLLDPDKTEGVVPQIILAHQKIQQAVTVNQGSVKTLARMVRDNNLPREAVPTEFLVFPEVWDALLERMPMTAMIRNLGNMAKSGLLKPNSDAACTISERLRDPQKLLKARVHPIQILLAMSTYARGQGLRGSGTWTVTPHVVDALDDAFYASFANVTPTGKRWVLGLDISGSMDQSLAGTPLTCRQGVAAMAMVTARTELAYAAMVFDTDRGGGWAGHSGARSIALSARQRLDDVIREFGYWSGGGTDCSLPMLWAQREGIKADTFVVYTDSETWAGGIHPLQALEQYRQKMGIPAKLVVVGMVSNGFTIADPGDAGMLDVVGFDTAVPKVISDFATA